MFNWTKSVGTGEDSEWYLFHFNQLTYTPVLDLYSLNNRIYVFFNILSKIPFLLNRLIGIFHICVTVWYIKSSLRNTKSPTADQMGGFVVKQNKHFRFKSESSLFDFSIRILSTFMLDNMYSKFRDWGWHQGLLLP